MLNWTQASKFEPLKQDKQKNIYSTKKKLEKTV